MSKRNSLIELYRFLFALVVVKNHGMFPYTGPYIGPGRIAVEFFFVLSGYLLIKSLDKFMELPMMVGLFKFIFRKIKSMFIPLVIALCFNIFYKILIKDYSLDIWGYLWYVEKMLLFFIIYFIIRKIFKNTKTFWIITTGIFVICAIIHVIPMFYSWGLFRAGMAISLGMLISQIPPLKLKNKNILWIILIPIQIIICLIFIFGNNLLLEEILDLILYPALIYLTFQINYEIKMFNYLGSLSFGLYAFQCVVRPLEVFGLSNVWIMFGIILTLSIIEDLVKRIIRFKKDKLSLQ